MKKIISLLFVCFCISSCLGQNYKVFKKISISGDEGWDYLAVDDINQHLFVSHGNVVNVIDLKTDKTIATIPATTIPNLVTVSVIFILVLINTISLTH